MNSNHRYSFTGLACALAAACLFFVSGARAGFVPPTPLLQPIRTYSNPTNRNSDNFGFSIADLHNGRIAVGAPDARGGSTNQVGAVYIFDTASATLVNTIVRTPFSSERFGGDIATVDASHLLVGARDGQTATAAGGVAYIVDVTTGTTTTTIPNPGNTSLDEFAFALDMLSNGQGIVGAYRDDQGARDAGVVHIINPLTGAAVQTIANPTPASDDFFGFEVVAVGNNFLVGAHNDNTAGNDAGAAYVYNLDSPATLRYTLLNPAPTVADTFGRAMSAVGSGKVLIGASNNDTGAENAGAAHLYDIATGNRLQTFYHPEPAQDDRFGSGLGSYGSQYIVIGAPQRDEQGSDTGAAYLFNAQSGALLAKIPNPDPTHVSQFGYSILATSEGVLIGGFGNIGAVYLFQVPEPASAVLGLLVVGCLLASSRCRMLAQP